jgi:formylglycine-generating enzyme required for sulfatase activity
MRLLVSLCALLFLPLSLLAQDAVIEMPNMVSITGGSFRRQLDLWRTSTVTVAGFQMSKTEITQALYEKLMGFNPSWFKGPKRPVEKVSWYDAVTFCNRLSHQMGFPLAYQINGLSVKLVPQASGFRLPTEAEWEYAARAGKTTLYAGANEPNPVAWFDLNAHHQGRRSPDYGTHNVGLKAGNGFGLFDMSGNVWEWCQDWYGPYPQGDVQNPVGALSGAGRVSRGGSWFHEPYYARVDVRYADGPYLAYSFQGFRVVRSPNGAPF